MVGGFQMFQKTFSAAIALAGACALFALAASEAQAGQPCTDGVDCYCDCVNGPNSGNGFRNAACQTKGIRVDTAALLCEDFEARELTQDVSRGVTSGNFGPWYDDTGYAGNRGNNAYWSRTYGPTGSDCSWRQGQPSNPQKGTPCAFGTCFGGEWSAGDPWGANAHACMDVMRNGEFDDEVTTNHEPTLPGGGQGVFDGAQIMGHRVQRGGVPGSVAGFHGSKSFGRAVTTIGITEALAYPSDVLSSRIFDAPWKDNQFQNGQEHWHRGSTGAGSKPDDLPYMPFRFANCSAALANARVLVGTAQCNSLGVMVGPADAYSQPRDFPWGTWGCSQAYMSGMNTSSMTWKIWHNGVLIVHIENIDGRAMTHPSYSNFSWNSYANYNQEAGQATTRTTYRYEDNVHIREGEPVSCQQVGFTSLTAPPPPASGGGDPTPPPPAPAPTLGKPGTPLYVP
jgi:hypothetical protein